MALVEEDFKNLQLHKNDLSYDFKTELQRIMDELTRLRAFGEGAITDLLQKNKLLVTARTSCNSFSEYFLNSQSGKCYIFGSPDAEHAIGGFVVPGTSMPLLGGVTYKIFDPNYGEYDFTNENALAAFMGKLKTIYKVDGKATRHEVVYRKS